MERRALTEFLEDFLRHGSQPAYVCRRGYRSERWSYRQLAQCAFQMARELESRGIARGDRVLLWGENCPEWVAAFFASVLRGVVVVPMDHSAAPDFARRVAAQVGAKLAICSREHAPLLPGLPIITLEDLLAVVSHHATAPNPAHVMNASDPLEIIFTSGTTADPKGVVISHGNVLSNVAPLETEIQKYLKYERWVHPIRFLNLLPLSHVFGQFLGIFLPPLLAGTVVFEEAVNPTQVMSTIRREGVSVLVAVPRMLQSLKEKILRDEEDAGRTAAFRSRFEGATGRHFLRRWWAFRRIHRQFGWKFWAMVSGGAALDRETEEFWGRLGYAVIQGYGLTETTSLVSVNHPFRLGRGSIGKVLPGREVRLSEDGEILVRGGGVATAYWTGTEIRPMAEDGGWYRTGDLGALDAEGNLYFKGRKKEVIVTPAGMNVYPEDLEAALRQQPEVRDCVIVPMPRGGNAEACAVMILRDSSADVTQVIRSANRLLAEYQRIQQWFLWPEPDFPRTSTQKPRINLIHETLLTSLRAQDASAATSSPLAELIHKVSGRNPGELRPDAKLEDDLHLSSLERVELMGALEDRYQVDLSEAGFSAVRTVRDLEQILSGRDFRPSEFHYPRWTLCWPTTWVRVLAYYMLVRPAILLLGWPRIDGRENLRGVRGPLLVISNHIDDVDVGFVQTALPARLRHRLATATGGESLQILRMPPPERWLLGRLYDRVRWFLGVALLNLFPLPRESGFRKSFAYAGECMDRGLSVLVFPEGHHTTDGKLRPFRAGIGLLANRLRVPILPIRINGLFEVKRTGRKFALPGQISIRIGRPLHFGPDQDPQLIADELQKAVEALAGGPHVQTETAPEAESGL